MKGKKRFRHIAAMLMAIVMLMSSMPMTAFAAETEDPTEKSMDLIVSSAAETVGNTVQVTISVANNPGIASLKFKVEFDSVLTLTDVTFNSAFGSMVTAPKPYTNPQTITLISPMEDVYANGILATLTFAINENAENGYVADVSVTYDAKDVFDSEEEPVTLNVVNGTVSMYTGMPGDVDGNEIVNTKDAVALFRYVAGWDVAVDPNALDVNGDDHVDTKDAIMLFRYVSGWEGILLSYSHDHRFSYTEAVDATCTEDGNIAYYYCSICKRYYTDAEATTRVDAENIVVKATGHSFSTEWTHDETHHWYAATCEHTDEVKDKDEHTYGDDKVCDVCEFDSNYLYKLAAPTDVAVAYDLVTWTAVPNADSYTVVVNGEYEYTTRNTECPLVTVKNSAGESLFADREETKQHGQVKVVVYANDNGEYTKSDASQVALYYYVPSSGTNQDATDYGIGLGYNMVNQGFYTGAESGQPVFDVGKLLSISTLSVNRTGSGHESTSYTYTSVDDYTETHTSNSSLNTELKGGYAGYTAELKADLSYNSSSTYTSHQYFCSYIIYTKQRTGTVWFDNQNTDLRIHCLSEQFVKDIRRESETTATMSDEQLCRYLYTTYGTHAALGIVKGGYFVTSYTVWTNDTTDLATAKDTFNIAAKANMSTYFNASLDIKDENNHSFELVSNSTVTQLISSSYGGAINGASSDKAAITNWSLDESNAVPLGFAGTGGSGAVALSSLIASYEKEFGNLGLFGDELGQIFAQYVDERADNLYRELYSQYTYEPPFDVEVEVEDGKNVLVIDLSMYQASGDVSAAGCAYFVDGIFTVYPNMLGEDIDAVRLIGGMDDVHTNKELLNGFTLALQGRWTHDVEIILENFGAAAKSDYGVVDSSTLSKTINVTVLYEGINIVKDTAGIYYCYVEHEDSSYRFVLTDEDGITWDYNYAGISEDGIYLPVVTKDNYDFTGWVTGSQTAITDMDGKLDTTLQLGVDTVTAYINWTPEIYTITLHSMGADTPGTEEIYLMYDVGYTDTYPTSEDFEKIDSITVPTKTGYIFGGYYTAEDVDETKVAIPGKIQYIDQNGRINDVIESRVAADIAFKDNIILYADWRAAQYQIVYVVQSSSAGDVTVTGSVEPTDCTYNASYTLRSGDDLECSGKTFAGWSLREDCTGETLNGGGTYTKNLSDTDGAVVTLYAVWTDNIAIKLQADSANNDHTTVLYLIPNSDYTAVYSDKDCTDAVTQLPQRPTRTGYTFGGYYDWVDNNSTPSPTGNNPRIDADGLFVSASYADLIDEDNTLEAMWTAIKYYVVYEPNASAVTNMPGTQTCYYDVAFALAGAPSRTGYTFSGWGTKTKVTLLYYRTTKLGDAGASVKNLAETEGATVTLYAMWTGNPYTVTYNANGGSGSTDNTTHRYGTDSALAACGFTRPDYTFLGWSTDPNDVKPEYTASQTVNKLSTGDTVTLYAIWAKTTFYSDSGDRTKTISEGSKFEESFTFASTLDSQTLIELGYTNVTITVTFDANVVYSCYQRVIAYSPDTGKEFYGVDWDISEDSWQYNLSFEFTVDISELQNGGEYGFTIRWECPDSNFRDQWELGRTRITATVTKP